MVMQRKERTSHRQVIVLPPRERLVLTIRKLSPLKSIAAFSSEHRSEGGHQRQEYAQSGRGVKHGVDGL